MGYLEYTLGSQNIQYHLCKKCWADVASKIKNKQTNNEDDKK